MGRSSAPFFSAFHALAVDDRRRWACFPLRLLPASHIQSMVNAIESAIPIPEVEITMHRAAWRQILRDGAPLAARGKHVHQAVHDVPHDHRPLAAATLGGREQRLDQRPLFIRQIAGVAKLAAVVKGSVFVRPHRAGTSESRQHHGNIRDSYDSRSLRTDTYQMQTFSDSRGTNIRIRSHPS